MQPKEIVKRGIKIVQYYRVMFCKGYLVNPLTQLTYI